MTTKRQALISFAVILCLSGQVVSQSTSKCNTRLQNGGMCVDKRQACPPGTYEFALYSNYIGCFTMTQKCCANVARVPTTVPTTAPPRTCGLGSLQPSERILDGSITGVCDWPFVVSIRGLLIDEPADSQLTYFNTQHACQGVLIDEQHVLTSCFCVFSTSGNAAEAPSRMLVVAGEYNVSGIDIDPRTGRQQEQLINVEQVFLHPDYAFTSQDQLVPFENTQAINSNGVALIKLKEPITGPCSGIACLPTPDEVDDRCAAYDECVITGWGFTSGDFTSPLPDGLLLGRVRLTSLEACDFITQRLNLSNIRPIGTTCQYPRNRVTDGCLGDEGGAILCSNGFNWVVRGILPFNLCQSGLYNLFVTEVASYVDWIEQIIRSSDGMQTRAG